MTRVEPQVAAWGLFFFKATQSVKRFAAFPPNRERGALWKLPQLRKSNTVAFGASS